jgi:hypothetical protein
MEVLLIEIFAKRHCLYAEGVTAFELDFVVRGLPAYGMAQWWEP